MNPFNVPTSVLHIPTQSKCCIHWWLFEHSNSPVSGVIPYLLVGGFLFGILTSTALAPILTPLFCQLLPLLRQDPNVQSIHHMNLAAILSWSHACCFVIYNGLFWWLAFHYSESLTPQDLIFLTLNGPTIAVFFIELGLYDNEITNEEIVALLGTATDGSMLWPSVAIFYCSDQWVSCWTPDNELWFQGHLLKRWTDITGCFKTHCQWLRSGFQTRHQAAQNVVRSEDYAKNICFQHDVEFLCSLLVKWQIYDIMSHNI